MGHSLIIAWRREQGVYCDAEGTIQHICNDSLENRALSCFDTRISINFDEIHPEIMI